jgi:hypothetical protein
VIENVPVVSCPHCRESYLTAETLHEVERIKLHRKAIARERCIAEAGREQDLGKGAMSACIQPKQQLQRPQLPMI